MSVIVSALATKTCINITNYVPTILHKRYPNLPSVYHSSDICTPHLHDDDDYIQIRADT